jgi:hypothetical protein
VRPPEFGKAEGRTADPPLRYAPVGMTILFGNARYGFQDELSSRRAEGSAVRPSAFPNSGGLTQTLAAAPRIVFIIGGITSPSDQAFGKTKMEARRGRRDSTQACGSDGGSGIDMKLLWENRRKYAHESQSDALPETRFVI